MSALDWPVDADGYPHREAARVLLFDGEGRVLLAKGHDEDQPERSWWFTIGGGIEAGEEPREAAASVRSMRKPAYAWMWMIFSVLFCIAVPSLISWPSPRVRMNGSLSLVLPQQP